MLLFADGFETFSLYDIWRKWGAGYWGIPSSGQVAPSIVHGTDNSVYPARPYARKNDGRALHGPIVLFTPLSPSRTLFMGFAFRIAARGSGVSPESYSYTIEFCGRFPYDKGAYPSRSDYPPPQNYYNPFLEVGAPPVVVAKCVMTIYTDQRIKIDWYFNKDGTGTYENTLQLMQSGYINANVPLTNGDWYYLQAGVTLNGNVVVQPQAWAEVRLGGRNDKTLAFENIMTGPESGSKAMYHFNGIRFNFGNPDAVHFGIMACDDVYICNNIGEVNNTFLGSIHVKRLSVSGDGTYTDAAPYGETYRFRTVDEDFIDTVNSLPSPIPDPETNPLFIQWEDFRGDYSTLEERASKQTMRFNSLNAQGSYPKVFGAILNALLQPQYEDTPSTITAIRRLNGGNIIESIPMGAPLIDETYFEMRHFVWENDEVPGDGENYINWTPAAFDASEWGFMLEPVAIDPKTYDSSLPRLTIIFNETLNESLGAVDFTHRYFEELVAESIGAADAPSYEFVWVVAETFGFTDGNGVIRAGNRFLNETIEFSEYLPYTILFAGESIGFSEAIFVQYIDLINETIDAADWADGFWEELFEDTFGATDYSEIAFILTLEEMFGLEEPYLWDNHELIEDEFAINADEPWDNHELVEEYLYLDDEVAQGVGLIAEDEIGISEDHFDGWWVELFTDYTLLADSVLTQHWRYDIVFGIVLDSWQVDPIEQYGSDGSHTGDNPWGA